MCCEESRRGELLWGQAAPRRRPQPSSRILTAWRDCPKRGPREASKADLDVMRRPKWLQRALTAACRATPGVLSKAFRTVSEGEFCEVELRNDGVLRSWLRDSAGGIMLVVEGISNGG